MSLMQPRSGYYSSPQSLYQTPQVQAQPTTADGASYLQNININNITNLPRDAYGHATYLIIPDGGTEDIKRFRELLSKEALLANVSDDQYLRLYQNDMKILTTLFDMGLRSQSMRKVFNVRYYSIINELGLTRIKDGAERAYQAGVGSNYVPMPGELSGFGSGLMNEPEEKKSGLAGLVNKFLGGAKKVGSNASGGGLAKQGPALQGMNRGMTQSNATRRWI